MGPPRFGFDKGHQCCPECGDLQGHCVRLHRPETKGARMCGRGKCDGVSEVYRGYARERRSQARRSRSWRAKQKKQGKASTLGGNQPNHTSCTLLPTATVTCRHLSLAIASSSPASCRRAHLPLFPHYFDAFLLQDCGACENRTDRDEAANGHAVDEDVPSQRTVNDKARAILTRPNVRHGGGRASHKETAVKKYRRCHC